MLKPPYGRVTAIDLNRGDTKWTAAIGDGPRNHPLLKDLNLPPMGAAAAQRGAGDQEPVVRHAMGSGNLGGGGNLPVGGRPLTKMPIEPTKLRALDKATGAHALGIRSAVAPAGGADDLHAAGQAISRGCRRRRPRPRN